MTAVLKVGAATVATVFLAIGTPYHVSAQPSPEMMLRNMDADSDGRISRSEWRRPPPRFNFFDANQDGYITLEELQARLGNAPAAGGQTAPGMGGQMPPGMQGQMADGQVPPPAIGRDGMCAILRLRSCDATAATVRGLFPTGLTPRFPEGLNCRGIDETYALDYSGKRKREVYHGGIDMPAPYGTPIVAAADGTVVSRIDDAENSYRGIELIVRHAPQDTGLPFWTYTQYAHFNEAPKHSVGQRVKMGEVLGPTGNSGTPGGSRSRRPAIHFAVWYSQSPSYAVAKDTAVPKDGWWMDPVAFYRKAPPYDSAAMKALPDDQKKVDIPVLVADGTVVPAGSKVIWPYTCTKSW